MAITLISFIARRKLITSSGGLSAFRTPDLLSDPDSPLCFYTLALLISLTRFIHRSRFSSICCQSTGTQAPSHTDKHPYIPQPDVPQLLLPTIPAWLPCQWLLTSSFCILQITIIQKRINNLISIATCEKALSLVLFSM